MAESCGRSASRIAPSQEFKGGDNYRHYDNFPRYPKEFPEDVTFTIGKSKEDEDWNFAQWSIYSKSLTGRFSLRRSRR